MSSFTTNPLDIPEILTLVGKHVPLWKVRRQAPNCHPRTALAFRPQDMLNCLLVSKTWHRTLLPVFWACYLSYATNPPLETIRKHAHLIRYASSYNHKEQVLNNLIDLYVVSTLENSQAIVKANSQLQRLQWFAWEPKDGIDPSALLEHLTDLKELRLIQSHFEPPKTIFRILRPVAKGLRRLYLQGPKGDLQSILGLEFPSLESLAMPFSKVSPEQPVFMGDILRHCPRLIDLTVYGDADFQQLALCLRENGQRLKRLVFKRGYGLTMATLAPVVEECGPNLTILKVSLLGMPPALADAILSHCKSLTQLSIRLVIFTPDACKETNRILHSSKGGMSHLRLLELKGLEKREIDALFEAPWNCPSLESLWIDGWKATLGKKTVESKPLKPSKGNKTGTRPADEPILGWIKAPLLKNLVVEEGSRNNAAFLHNLFPLVSDLPRLKSVQVNAVRYARSLL